MDLASSGIGNRHPPEATITFMQYLLLLALIAGLILYYSPLSANEKASRTGQMLLFSSILALLIAVAPLTVKLLHG
jgi:hypothetical protein